MSFPTRLQQSLGEVTTLSHLHDATMKALSQKFIYPAFLAVRSARYPLWFVGASSSSTIFRPSIISKVKRTTPFSLPLCSR